MIHKIQIKMRHALPLSRENPRQDRLLLEREIGYEEEQSPAQDQGFPALPMPSLRPC